MTVSLPVTQRIALRQCTAIHGTGLKTAAPRGTGSYSRRALPTDSIGNVTITLTNIVDGSSLQIESQDGTQTFHNSVVSGTSKAVTLQVYAAGSPYNALRIKVRKGSASPFYQPWETLATAIKGSASIYVAQIPDE